MGGLNELLRAKQIGADAVANDVADSALSRYIRAKKKGKGSLARQALFLRVKALISRDRVSGPPVSTEVD